MELREKLFSLHQMEGVGRKTLMNYIQSDCNRLPFAKMGLGEWRKITNSETLAERLFVRCKSCNLQNDLTAYHNRGIDFMTLLDDEYPTLLRETADPPVVLYGRGQWSLLHMPCIAVVGTRVATVYGKRIAFQFAEQLAEAGVCIVSGLASGIDGQAHEGALHAGGTTIAVLGCSLEHVYPKEHRTLYERIAERGLLLSEYPLGTAPQAGLFPMRNRIIAGLSSGTLVVEAALRSGSLITAHLALDASRDVFAVPGAINSPKSAGTLELIKQGAKMVTSVQDILQDYQYQWSLTAKTALPNGALTEAGLNPEELRLLEHLSADPVSFDELLELMQYEFGQLHSLLLSLLLKKRILQHPGMCYTLIT